MSLMSTCDFIWMKHKNFAWIFDLILFFNDDDNEQIFDKLPEEHIKICETRSVCGSCYEIKLT